MRKLVWPLALALTLGTFIAGCGKKEDNAAKAEVKAVGTEAETVAKEDAAAVKEGAEVVAKDAKKAGESLATAVKDVEPSTVTHEIEASIDTAKPPIMNQ